jgi:hypothetical protein
VRVEVGERQGMSKVLCAGVRVGERAGVRVGVGVVRVWARVEAECESVWESECEFEWEWESEWEWSEWKCGSERCVKVGVRNRSRQVSFLFSLSFHFLAALGIFPQLLTAGF